MVNKLLILLFFVLSAFFELEAQYENIRFSRLTVSDGLSQNAVSYIYQDSRGFMWFATASGLNRYDGYNFKMYTYNPDNPGSISDNSITGIYEDREGTLWVGTMSGGLNRYDRIHDSFTSFKNDPGNPESIAGNHIRGIFEDSMGNFWVGMRDNGINKLDRKTGKFTRGYLPLRNPDGYGTVVWEFSEDRYGNLWMGTSGNGLYVMNGATGKITSFLEHTDDLRNGTDDKIRCLHLDNKQNLWIGSFNGIKKISLEEYYRTGKFEFKKFSTKGIGLNDVSALQVNDICEDENGMLWIGTSGGLALFNPVTEKFIVYKYIKDGTNGLAGEAIYSVYREKSGIIWLGVQGGINIFDNKRNRFNVFWYKSRLTNSINFRMESVPYEDREGNFWFVKDGGKIICVWNKPDNTVKEYVPEFTGNRNIYDLLIDSKYRFWVSLLGDDQPEVIEFNPVTLKIIRRFPIDALGITEDRQGLLWFTSWSHLSMLDPQNNIIRDFMLNKNSPAGSDYNSVDYIFVDTDNTLWVRSRTGFFKKDRDSERFITLPVTGRSAGEKGSINNGEITAMYDDNKGNLWLTTYGGGLNKYDKKKNLFTYTDKDSGFADNFMNSILPDRQGNLWISSKRGISKYNPVDGTIKNYGIEDGLQGKEFTFPAFKSQSGEMFFGGEEGLNYFYPDSIKDNRFIPPVVFTSFKIDDKAAELDTSIILKKEITLPYSSNFFSIEFAALSYTNPSLNKYKYRLEGIDRDWINTGAANRTANYTNIEPGEYTFRVKGSNNDGVWNEEGAFVKIIITPPWWQTWWTRGFFVLAVISVLWYTRHRKLSMIQKEMALKTEFTKQLINTQEAERKRIAGELHDSLGQNLLLIRNKVLLKIRDSGDAGDNEISELTSKAINEVRSISHNLTPYELETLGLTEAVESILDNLRNATGMVINSEIDNIDGILLKENEINFYRIIQECTANILKHSNANKVLIKIIKTQDAIMALIRDDGTGFDTKDLKTRNAGMGMAGIQERVNILRGTMTVQSESGGGTEINIKIII